MSPLVVWRESLALYQGLPHSPQRLEPGDLQPGFGNHGYVAWRPRIPLRLVHSSVLHLPLVHMSFGVFNLLVTVTLVIVWTTLNYRSSFPIYLCRSPGGCRGGHCDSFSRVCLPLSSREPSTYVPCIMLGEGEWQSDVKEGCIESYKYSAVVFIGL